MAAPSRAWPTPPTDLRMSVNDVGAPPSVTDPERMTDHDWSRNEPYPPVTTRSPNGTMIRMSGNRVEPELSDTLPMVAVRSSVTAVTTTPRRRTSTTEAGFVNGTVIPNTPIPSPPSASARASLGSSG